jgi:hypothetical protein
LEKIIILQSGQRDLMFNRDLRLGEIVLAKKGGVVEDAVVKENAEKRANVAAEEDAEKVVEDADKEEGDVIAKREDVVARKGEDVVAIKVERAEVVEDAGPADKGHAAAARAQQ